MSTTLAPDSTLRDLKTTMDGPENFVRQVVGSMMRIGKQVGEPVVVRLGVTGKGRAPNYRIETVAEQRLVAAIDGANHSAWPEDVRFDATSTWSTATMTLPEGQMLLGDIRS